MRGAFLVAIPLIMCRTGVHVPEGGGEPVRQKFEKADRTKRKANPEVAQAPAEPPQTEPPQAEPPQAEPPPRVAKAEPPAATPKPRPKARATPQPKRRPPVAARPPVRPSPHLCGDVSPQLTDPRPMSNDERKPLAETVDQNIGEIRACYEEARLRAKVDGCMFAVFTVDNLGQLRQPYIDTSNITDPVMQSCVTDAIGAMDLRAPVDNAVWVVLYPFFFERGEIFHSSQHKRASS